MTKRIMTVLGPVSPSKLGITDAHSHLWIEPLNVLAPNSPVLDRQELIQKELTVFHEAGGSGQLDCQPGGAGRNGNKLRELAEETGVQVIACTGFHLKEYYPQDARVWEMDLVQALEYFMAEIDQGLYETRTAERVYPGFIKIAVRETLEESPHKLMEAAALASQKSGLLIEMHTQKGAKVEDFVTYFSNLGLPADRLVICHIDKRPDTGLHQELAAEGYLLEYDTFFRSKYKPEDHLWPLLKKMVASGFSKSVALATDLADSSQWESFGGKPGLAGFPIQIGKRIQQEFNNDSLTERLMGGNIADRLAVAI